MVSPADAMRHERSRFDGASRLPDQDTRAQHLCAGSRLFRTPSVYHADQIARGDVLARTNPNLEPDSQIDLLVHAEAAPSEPDDAFAELPRSNGRDDSSLLGPNLLTEGGCLESLGLVDDARVASLRLHHGHEALEGLARVQR